MEKEILMKKKQILYTSLAAVALATAGVAVVHADDTSASSTDASSAVVASTDASSTTESSSSSTAQEALDSTSTSSQDQVQEVKLDMTVSHDTQNNIVFDLKPQIDVDLGNSFYLGDIRTSRLENGTPIVATTTQGMRFDKVQNKTGYYENIWNLYYSGSEKDPYSDNGSFSKSVAGNYRLEIDQIITANGKKYHLTGSVDFGMNDKYGYAPLKSDTTAEPSTSASTETQASSSTAKSEESVASSTSSSSTEAKKDETKASSTAASSDDKTKASTSASSQADTAQSDQTDNSSKSSSSDKNTKASTAASSSDKGTKASSSDKEAKEAKEVFPVASTASSSSSSAQGTKTVNPVATATNPAQTPKRTLPSTGEEKSVVLTIVGIVLAGLGLFSFRKLQVKK